MRKDLTTAQLREHLAEPRTNVEHRVPRTRPLRWAEGSRRALLQSQERTHRRLAAGLASPRYRRLIAELEMLQARHAPRLAPMAMATVAVAYDAGCDTYFHLR